MSYLCKFVSIVTSCWMDVPLAPPPHLILCVFAVVIVLCFFCRCKVVGWSFWPPPLSRVCFFIFRISLHSSLTSAPCIVPVYSHKINSAPGMIIRPCQGRWREGKTTGWTAIIQSTAYPCTLHYVKPNSTAYVTLGLYGRFLALFQQNKWLSVPLLAWPHFNPNERQQIAYRLMLPTTVLQCTVLYFALRSSHGLSSFSVSVHVRTQAHTIWQEPRPA